MAYSLLVRNAAAIELLRKHLWALPFWLMTVSSCSAGPVSYNRRLRSWIQQGVDMRRPSEIHVEVVRKDSGALGIRMGERCAIMGEGAVFLERAATSAQPRA